MKPSGQPVATGRKWDGADNRSNKRIRNRWQPTATVPKRMVKRGVDGSPAETCGTVAEVGSKREYE
jgi:hypothetical protein